MKQSPVEFGRMLASLMKRFADKREGPLLARLEALEAEVAALKAHESAMKYMGVWSAEMPYSKGNFVTHSGSLWHANRPTIERPGNGSHDWTLAVKSGRDAPRLPETRNNGVRHARQ